jgi:hypothetical protein
MGPELLALTDAYPAGILAVPGARVASIITDSALFGTLIVLLRPRGTTDGDVQRFFPLLQTVIDRGDSGSYAGHVLRDRLRGDPAFVPSIVAGVALDDDTVPNTSNYALARALGIPIAPVVLRPVPGLVEATVTPLEGNFGGGTATAGLLQFDVVPNGAGGTETATHSNTPGSDVGARAWLEFMTAHWNDGLARIVDPYVLEGVPHAE